MPKAAAIATMTSAMRMSTNMDRSCPRQTFSNHRGCEFLHLGLSNEESFAVLFHGVSTAKPRHVSDLGGDRGMDTAVGCMPQRIVAPDGTLFDCQQSGEAIALSTVAILQGAYEGSSHRIGSGSIQRIRWFGPNAPIAPNTGMETYFQSRREHRGCPAASMESRRPAPLVALRDRGFWQSVSELSAAPGQPEPMNLRHPQRAVAPKV